MPVGPSSTPGDRAVRFINRLSLTDDYVGQPFRLRPWQEKIVRQLFGSLDEQGRRLITEALLFLPRKQGKTELAAAIGLYGTLGIGKAGQEALVAASDRKQASHLFKKAVSIVQADRYLDKRCKLYHSAKVIEDRQTGNTLEVVSSDAHRQHGHNPSLVIIDEVHTQPNRELYDALKRAFGTRLDHLLLLVSTAGNRRDTLIYEQYQYACKVRDGLIDNPHYLPIIFEAGPDDDWTDEATWAKAMPALGDFCHLEFIRQEFAKAKEIPAEESAFKQYFLNLWVAGFTKWMNRPAWERCGRCEVDPDDLIGEPAFGGLDLANVSDIAAFSLVFPHDRDFKAIHRYWIPAGYATECDRKRGTKYVEWAKAGLIALTDGDSISHEDILRTIIGDDEQDIPGLIHRYDIRKIRIDDWNHQYIGPRLADAGIEVETVRTGMASMTSPTKFLNSMLSEGRMHHGDNPVLNWMADNAVAERRGDALMLSKDHSADKIDGMISLILALAAAKEYVPPLTPKCILMGDDED